MLNRCRYTKHHMEGDIDDVILRVSALWLIVTATPVSEGLLADEQLLDWVAAAGTRRAARSRRLNETLPCLVSREYGH
jgi:hypothetical protein